GNLSRIDRIGKRGIVSGSYKYEWNDQAAAAEKFPVACTYQTTSSSYPFSAHYVFKEISLHSEPDLSPYLVDWNKPGSETWDRRVNPEVHWTFDELVKANGGDKKITPTQLLRLSRQKSAYMHELDRREQAIRARDESRRLFMVLTIGIVVLAMAAIPLVVKLLRKIKATT
ncbi:MAG: hypothetical protein ABUL49_00910, partial [bacterium]